MIKIEEILAASVEDLSGEDVLGLGGAALCERLDEHNRLTKAHTQLLRGTVLTTSREAVLDEVEVACRQNNCTGRSDALGIVEDLRDPPA